MIDHGSLAPRPGIGSSKRMEETVPVSRGCHSIASWGHLSKRDFGPLGVSAALLLRRLAPRSLLGACRAFGSHLTLSSLAKRDIHRRGIPGASLLGAALRNRSEDVSRRRDGGPGAAPKLLLMDLLLAGGRKRRPQSQLGLVAVRPHGRFVG